MIDAIEALVKGTAGRAAGGYGEEYRHLHALVSLHLQKAQPITLAHHMGAYFEMFSRDRSRLKDIRRRMNYCPLGSRRPGRHHPILWTGNTRQSFWDLTDLPLIPMDSVADRDYLIELLSALSTISMHFVQVLREEIIIWNTNEYRFCGD